MGLLDLFRGFRRPDREARLLILGLDNSGKTTILRKLSNEDISIVMPTQGFNVKSLSHASLKFNVWDVGGEMIYSFCPYIAAYSSYFVHTIGQKAIRPYWRNYYDSTDALVYCIADICLKRFNLLL
jgi:ADP-ribosylation factor-like protein 3